VVHGELGPIERPFLANGGAEGGCRRPVHQALPIGKDAII
jgi:hypothetical protein